MNRKQRQLLQEAKDKLRVTWIEEDAHIWRLVEGARVELDGLCRTPLNYDVPGLAKTLMLEHVFYNRNNALHEYRNAYEKELTELVLGIAAGGEGIG
jgi:hypothetical protein